MEAAAGPGRLRSRLPRGPGRDAAEPGSAREMQVRRGGGAARPWLHERVKKKKTTQKSRGKGSGAGTRLLPGAGERRLRCLMETRVVVGDPCVEEVVLGGTGGTTSWCVVCVEKGGLERVPPTPVRFCGVRHR